MNERWKVLLLLGIGLFSALRAVGEAPAAVMPTATVPATALFAGGCFWCMEADFEKVPGVIAVESGYSGGHTVNPSYEEVGSGGTGHAETVRVSYDPARLSYGQLLDYFWRHIDPTVADRQFCDAGDQYRSAIFTANEAEQRAAEASRDALLASGRFESIRTQITAAGAFYPAEEYHQDYYRKNPLRYAYYRNGCGRDDRLRELWGSEP
jgi:peptide-methionine (S)-S-oxide reductase